MPAATYSESNETKTLREFNKDIPRASYCIPAQKPSFSDQVKSGMSSFINSRLPMITDLKFESELNGYDAPTVDSLLSLIVACKVIKTKNFGIKSYTALEEGGVSIDLTFKHNHYLILEFYNSGEAVLYVESPGKNPMALDLDHNSAISKLTEILS